VIVITVSIYFSYHRWDGQAELACVVD